MITVTYLLAEDRAVMEEYLSGELKRVLATWPGVPEDFEPELEIPNNPDHGDLATNTALRLARHLRKSPLTIAQELKERLDGLPLDPDRVLAVEVAGAGFLNFRFSENYLYRQLRELLDAGSDYGRGMPTGDRALVEYVSANPTGPLTVGHGRNAVLGDTIANLLEWSGLTVTREYYFNDAGRQMRVLSQSVRARYEQLVNPSMSVKPIEGPGGDTIQVPETFPEDGYLGEYIIDIARKLREDAGDSLVHDHDLQPFKEIAEESIFAEIETTLERLGIRMDTYFNEHTLYENGKVWETLDRLRQAGFVYDKDGAVWFKASALGRDQDKVLVKSSGEPTYRLPDIAYHANKLDRDFNAVVDIFGADHIATYPDVLAALDVLGYEIGRVKVIIYQFVTLVRGGEPVKMSTRKATYETLDDLLDEVGEDVTRYFFLMRSPNTHLEFDLDLAKEASEKNPVFYLQYAHARICQIEAKAQEVGFSFGAKPDLKLLSHETEIGLIKTLLRLPAAIEEAARLFEPHRLTVFLREVAVSFTKFYDSCRIVGEEKSIATARMHLARATRTVLANGLAVLGISAPERM